MEAVYWLASGGPLDEVGGRVEALVCLARAGLPVPPGFVIGRPHFDRYCEHARVHSPRIGLTSLPEDTRLAIETAIVQLGPGPVAVRRSSLAPARDRELGVGRRGSRSDRETFLHVTDVADVVEAVRRMWGEVLASHPVVATAVLVQRFVLADTAAILRSDPEGEQLVGIESTYGFGDMLAAGLVVPDRYRVRVADGMPIERSMGRKTQMSVARRDGGVVRVPVPSEQTRQWARDDSALPDLVALWRAAEGTLGPLVFLGVATEDGRNYLTSVRTRQRA